MNTLNRSAWAVIITISMLGITESCRKADFLPEQSTNGDIAAQKVGNPQALPHTRQFAADVATDWFTLLTDITRTKPYFSPQALRIFAYSGMALYESVVPGMPAYQSMYTYFTGNSIEHDKKKDYYWPAAANAALARVATRVMQDYPAAPLSQLQTLEEKWNTSFNIQVNPEQLQRSIAFGKYVADKIYEWSRSDGTLNSDGSLAVCPPYVPLGGPGNWVPTPPFFFPAVGECQGKLRTFIPGVVTQVHVPPPPAYDTDPASAFYKAAEETFLSRNNISTAGMNQFNNWRDAAPNYNPLAHMLRISTGILIKEKVNLEDAATLYAKQTIAASDVIAAVFYSKFKYSLQRPVTYIRNVLGAATWSSLPITPQTPSYPDELAATASSAVILEDFFGSHYEFVDSIHRSAYGAFHYSGMQQMLAEIVQARVSGGTIYRFAGEAGVMQGRAVGAMVNGLPFKKP